MGSPPRVREKLFFHYKKISFIRITPACAGKTYRKKADRKWTRDHPRVCGKNKSLWDFNLQFQGSPPRVREKTLVNQLTSTP